MNLRLGLLGIGVYGALILCFTVLSGDLAGSAAGPGIVDPNDCTTFTPTPTITQTPTPSPPFTPFSDINICNDTGLSVSDLHVVVNRNTTSDLQASMSVAGCPVPSITYVPGSGLWTRVDVNWGSPCVAAGKQVGARLYADCTTPEPGCGPGPLVSCFYWTQSGDPVVPVDPHILNPPICPLPSPSPTPLPGPCAARGTPPVTYAPTPTPATPTPTPGPTSRDVVIITTVPFCNDAGQAASDLHIQFAFPYSGAGVETNAPGCPAAQLDEGFSSLDKYRLDIDWGAACVESGESVTVNLTYLCGDVPCATPQPYCYTWTLFGDPLASGQSDCPTGGVTPTPTPTPTAQPSSPTPGTPTLPCPAGPAPSGGCLPCPTWPGMGVIASTCAPIVSPSPTPAGPVLSLCATSSPPPTIPTPSPTPIVDIRGWTFTNETGQAASDLHSTFTGIMGPRCLVQNAPGCPLPVVGAWGFGQDLLNLDWGTSCVDPGESVIVSIVSEPPEVRICYHWTIGGVPIGTPCAPTNIWGDANCDNSLNAVDALIVLRKVAGLPVPYCAHSADVDCSGGAADATDALKILRWAAGLPTSQEQGCPLLGDGY